METLNALGVILNIGGTLGLSVLGMFAVAWVNANTTPTTGAFSLSIFWRDNATMLENKIINGKSQILA